MNYLTYSKFLDINKIGFEKNLIFIGIFESFLVDTIFIYNKIYLNTLIRLNSIKSLANKINYIFKKFNYYFLTILSIL